MAGKYLGIIALALTGAPLQGQALATAEPAQSQPAAAAVPLSRIPAESFARIPFIDEVELSPDGTRIAGLFGVNGRQVLMVRNLFDKTEKSVGTVMSDETEASYIQWVNDDNLVVGLRALLPIEGGERWIISRLIGFNRVTGKITKLLWDRGGQNANLVWSPSDGSPAILMATQNSIYLGEEFWPSVTRVDVQTGKSDRVMGPRPGVSRWVADAAGNIRSATSYDDDSRKFKMLYRPESGSGALRIIDIAESRKQEGLLDPFLFLPGGNNALAIHEDAKGNSAVYEVDLLTQTDVRQVYAAPAGYEVAGIRLSADGRTLLGIVTSGGAEPVRWLDPDLAKIQAALDAAVGSRRARIVSMSKDRSRMLVRVDRPESPGALFFFSTDAGKLQQISTYNEALGLRVLNPVKLIRYSARDGTPIEAVLTLPRERPAQKLPIVIMPHGGPWAQDTADYDYWAQFIASRGYAVLQPNFRGSTGYGSAFVRAGEGQMGLAMQDDLSDALAWAAKEGLADPARACIVGASYGGYAAMWGLAKDPVQYRCAVSIAGVANLRREVNDFGNSLYGNKYKDDWKRMTPDFAAVSPANAVARINAPLLLIHGKKDITVDFNQSNAMYKRMKDAGKAVSLVALPEADHHFTREADRIVLLKSIEDFLAQHNPSGLTAAN